MVKGFIAGIVVVVAAFIAGGYLFVKLGLLPAGQDSTPGKLETWAAKTSLAATISRGTRGLTSQIPPTEANLTRERTFMLRIARSVTADPTQRPPRLLKG